MEEWQHPASLLYSVGPWAQRQDGYSGHPLDARVDSLRGWQNILSACDPHWAVSYRGQDLDQENGWMNRVAGGELLGREKKKKNRRRDVWDLAVVKLICSVLQPLLLPSPWCCSQKCSAKNPLVAMAPQAPAWLTPCHIILWQCWWRESAEEWYWEVAGDLHTGTCACIHTNAQMHACTYTYTVDTSPKDTLRSSSTDQLGGGNTSWPWCVCLCAYWCSRGGIHWTLGMVHRGAQMFCTSCTWCSRDVLF